MCIAVHADGPITIDFMLETIIPVSLGGSVRAFNQSFDLVVKNLSSQPLDRLVVVHPRRLYPSEAPGANHDPWIANIPFWARGEWFGRRLHKSDSLVEETRERRIQFAVRADLRLPPTAERFALHTAQLLDPAGVVPHPAIAASPGCRRLVGGRPALPTVLAVNLQRPMQPHVDGDWTTVYYVRINLAGVPVTPITSERMPLDRAGEQSSLLKQVFAVMAPSLVARRLENRLALIAEEGADETDQGAAATLFRSLVEDGLLHPSKTTRIRDHRLAVVVPRHMLFDSREFGKLLPWETKRLAADDGAAPSVEDRARIWLAGAATFPESDPLLIARRVARHMTDDAGLSKRVGYFSEVGLAMASECPLLQNTGLVIEALTRLGTISRHDHEAAWALARPPGPHDHAEWLKDLKSKIASQKWELDLRSVIAALALHGRRFEEQPFLLHCAFTGVSRQR